MKNQQYRTGNLRKFIEAVRHIDQTNPGTSIEFIETQLAQWYPELRDREHCPNCGGSMKQLIFKFDVVNALLLIDMSWNVKENMIAGKPFTEANKVHVQKDLLRATYATKSRTTQCRQLGLIAKVKNEKGRQIPGTWCITARGWAALRGEDVPAEVTTFQNTIVERSEKTTTIRQALNSHKEYLQKMAEQHKTPKNDYSKDIRDFEEFDWVHFGEVAEGKML